MNYKRTISLLLILSLVLTISPIIPREIHANEGIKVSTFEELVDACNTSNIIELQNDIIFTEEISITSGRNISIYGNGYTMQVATPYLEEDGSNATDPSTHYMFYIKSNNVKLNLYDMPAMGGTRNVVRKENNNNNVYFNFENVIFTRTRTPIRTGNVTYMKHCRVVISTIAFN